MEHTAQTESSSNVTMMMTSVQLCLGEDSLPLFNNGLVEREDAVMAAHSQPTSAVSSNYCFVLRYIKDKLKTLQRNFTFKDNMKYEPYIYTCVSRCDIISWKALKVVMC